MHWTCHFGGRSFSSRNVWDLVVWKEMALEIPSLHYSSLLIKGITWIILSKKRKMLKVKLIHENNNVSLICWWKDIPDTGTYWYWNLLIMDVSFFINSTSWGALHSKDKVKVFRSYLLSSSSSPFFNNRWLCTDLSNWSLAFLGLDPWWLVKPSLGPYL